MTTDPTLPGAVDGGPLPVLLTVAEAAEILRCSEKTIRRRIAAGPLPATKLGNRWLFAAAAIQRALIADGSMSVLLSQMKLVAGARYQLDLLLSG